MLWATATTWQTVLAQESSGRMNPVSAGRNPMVFQAGSLDQGGLRRWCAILKALKESRAEELQVGIISDNGDR